MITATSYRPSWYSYDKVKPVSRVGYNPDWTTRGEMYAAALKAGYLEREIAWVDPSYKRVWKWKQVDLACRGEGVFMGSMVTIMMIASVCIALTLYYQYPVNIEIWLAGLGAVTLVVASLGLRIKAELGDIASKKEGALEQTPLTKEEAEPVLVALNQLYAGNKV